MDDDAKSEASTIRIKGPVSSLAAVNDRMGFVFHLPSLLPDHNSAASRLSLVRQKHLSHIDALRADGFDFLPPDAHLQLASDPTTTSSPSKPMPARAAWKERLLSSATASTLKIAGITKKLKNKVILLRDAIVPPFLNPPPPPVYDSLATPATPTPFANLPPPTVHTFGVKRIVCIRDIIPSLESEFDDDSSSTLRSTLQEHADDARSLMSTSRQRKALSTLPEEDYADFASSIGDEEDVPDVYVEAILTPVENLARAFSPNRSRVSPPWVNKELASGSLRPPQGRPLTSSTARSSELGGMSPVSSIMAHLHPEQHRFSFMSSTESSYGTNARRRSSSLVMLPLQPPSGRSRSSTPGSNRRDKENEPTREYQHATFGKGKVPLEAPEQDEEDDEEGEEQEYYVFEAEDPNDDGTEDGQRESVIVLMPIPPEGKLASRWSSTVGSDGDEPEPLLEGEDLDTISNPFLTPHPTNGKPLPSLPPSSRRTSYTTAPEVARPNISRNATASSSRYHTPPSHTPAVSRNPSNNQSRKILSLTGLNFDDQPEVVPRPQSKKKQSRPITPLEWNGAAPVPMPSPSFPVLAPLAPPSTKRRDGGRSEEDLVTPRTERFEDIPNVTRNRSSSLSTSTFGGGSGKSKAGPGTPKQRPPPRLIAERIDAPSPLPYRQRTNSITTARTRSDSRSSGVKTPTRSRNTSRARNSPAPRDSPALPLRDFPAPTTPKIKPKVRIPPPTRPPPPPPTMSRRAEEFIRSSGKAFQGLPFQSIEVVDVDSGTREVFVDGKERPKSFTTSRTERRVIRQRPSV